MDKKIKLEMNKNKDIVISVNDDEKITIKKRTEKSKQMKFLNF